MVMTIQEIRSKYPQYNELSDIELGDRLHSKYYADMPKDQFYGKIGISSPESTEQSAIQKQLSSIGINPSFENSKEVFSGLGQGAKGVRDALFNTFRGIPNIVPGVNIPPAKSGEGAVYDVANIAGEIGGFLGGGELLDLLRAGTAAKGIPVLSNLAEAFSAGPGKRVAGNMIGGALENEENRLEGANEQGGWASLFELLGKTPKALGAVAEKINPEKYTQAAIESIAPAYEAAKERVSNEFYKPVTEGFFKNVHIDKAGRNITKDTEQRLGSSLAAHTQDFLKKPTLDNAHKLQKIYGDEIRSIKKSNPFPNTEQSDQIRFLTQKQDALNDKVVETLEKRKRPDLASLYKQAPIEFRENVQPFRAHKEIVKAIQDRKEDTTPKRFLGTLKAAKETGDVPSGHFLDVMHQDLGRKINQGELIGLLAPYVSSATVGTLGSAFGPIGAGLGALAGAGAANPVIRALQNPELERMFSGAGLPADLIRKAILAHTLGSQQ